MLKKLSKSAACVLGLLPVLPTIAKESSQSKKVNGIPLEILLIAEEIAKFSGDKEYLKNFTPKPVPKAVVTPKLSKEEEFFLKQRQQFQQQNKSQQKQFADTATSQAKSFNQVLEEAKKRHAAIIEKWKQEHLLFRKEVPHLKNALTKITDTQKTSLKKNNTPVSKVILNPYKIVYKSMDVPIKSQGRRPTCSAFAGVRMLEILLAQRGSLVDLSEQHFYWMSKPSCQKNKCGRRGAWVTMGFYQSKKNEYAGIATESSCPYGEKQINGNETQLPLSRSCLTSGKTRVANYRRFENLDEVVSLIDADIPVAVATGLSSNFYEDHGFIPQKTANEGKKKMDSHAKGHALVIMGYMKLPRKVHSTEGKVCFLVANSWGEGWGKG